MKNYTRNRPPVKGNALKAWNVLTKKNFWEKGNPPLTMKYSRKGCKWVGYWDDINVKTDEVKNVFMPLYKEDGTENKVKVRSFWRMVRKGVK